VYLHDFIVVSQSFYHTKSSYGLQILESSYVEKADKLRGKELQRSKLVGSRERKWVRNVSSLY